jgi:hypothetical protein
MRGDPLKVEQERTPGTVPTFVTEQVEIDSITGSISMLAVVCQRGDCKCEFWVNLKWAVGGYGTRPCPYCFRVSWIPGRENTRPKGKHVVKTKRRRAS